MRAKPHARDLQRAIDHSRGTAARVEPQLSFLVGCAAHSCMQISIVSKRTQPLDERALVSALNKKAGRPILNQLEP